MHRVIAMMAVLFWAGTGFSLPGYLWGEIPVPEGAVRLLPAKAGDLGIPFAQWTEKGLEFSGASDETQLLGSGAYLYLDGGFFLLGVDAPGERAVLKGSQSKAELIVWPSDGIRSPALLELAQRLGLIPAECAIALTMKEVPVKLPRPPEGVRLDPVLWTLVGHPDWFGFARDYGIERVGLRVRAVAEVTGPLGTEFEPYVASSSAGLVELLLPIPLLVQLGRDPAVKTVRLPYVPHPAGG